MSAQEQQIATNTEPSSLRQFVDELVGSPEPEQTETADPPAEGETQQKKAKPRNLAELAERLEVEPSELYDLEVAISDGEESKSVKLGELKDKYSQAHTLEVERLKWEEAKAKEEQNQLRAKDELQTILMHLKDKLPKGTFDALLQAGRLEHARRMDFEIQRTKQIIPEWASEDVSRKEIAQINEHLEPYFGKNAMKQFNSANLIKYVRDNWLRAERVKRALEAMETKVATPKAQRSSKPQGPAKAPVSTKKSKDKTRDFVDSLFS